MRQRKVVQLDRLNNYISLGFVWIVQSIRSNKWPGDGKTINNCFATESDWFMDLLDSGLSIPHKHNCFCLLSFADFMSKKLKVINSYTDIFQYKCEHCDLNTIFKDFIASHFNDDIWQYLFCLWHFYWKIRNSNKIIIIIKNLSCT